LGSSQSKFDKEALEGLSILQGYPPIVTVTSCSERPLPEGSLMDRDIVEEERLIEVRVGVVFMNE